MTIAPMPIPTNRQSAKVLSTNACTGRPPELGTDEGGVVRHTICVSNGRRTTDYGREERAGSRMISAFKQRKTAPIYPADGAVCGHLGRGNDTQRQLF